MGFVFAVSIANFISMSCLEWEAEALASMPNPFPEWVGNGAVEDGREMFDQLEKDGLGDERCLV
jgi:hypothetical protein